MAERTIERWGRSFELAPKVGLLPLLRFAHLAKQGMDSTDIEGMDAMYVLLRQCFTAESWAAFEDAATEALADGDELLEVVGAAMTAMTARPTGRPSDSSGGSQTTSTNSAGDSSSPVIDRLVEKGRPDLALIVTQAQASRASA